jgi:hypothetical protein
MGQRRWTSHLYERVVLCVGRIHTKYGASDARRGGVMTLQVQKIENY